MESFSNNQEYFGVSMIITDDFIMLNFPKTGSSFCRKTIKDIYEKKKSLLRKFQECAGLSPPSFIELMHKHPFLDAVDQHGTYSQIPEEYLGRKIVSVTRNPLTRYYSDYLYRWWASNPPANIDVLSKEYPGFPNIGYADYYNLTAKYAVSRRLCGAKPKIEVGLHTIQFIYFYFKNPVEVIESIDHEYIESDEYKKDMVDVHFLRQENLVEDLQCFLIEKCGFSVGDFSKINRGGRINVSDKKNEVVISGEDINLVNTDILKKDRLIFKIFPEYVPAAEACRVE